MPVNFENKLVIAISSRALFDLEQSHQVFVEKGIDAYCQYQIKHENETLAPGVAFNMVKKFLALNALGEQQVEIVLISRNSADTGLRLFNSIAAYNLDITRAAFTGGQSPYPYARPFGAHLFLSADPNDVAKALDNNIAAATILLSKTEHSENDQLKIAFDGDSVLFSNHSEKIFQDQGLAAFTENERRSANDPLPGGPFKTFLAALHNIQMKFPNQAAPIRTALVTARSAPAHERVIRTLRAWNVRIDESFFLGGMDKGEFLRSFDADIYFDDQDGHCLSASQFVPTGHVPNGPK